MTDDEGDLALLGDLLERSFDAGPEGLPTPAERLAEGRRVLRRRRRIGIVATSAGVVAAIGVGVALSGATGDHGGDGAPAVATSSSSPSTAPTETPATVASPAPKSHRQQQRLVSDMFPASFDYDGSIVVKDGWHITRQVDEPVGLLPPEKSLGVVVERGDQVRWMLLTLQVGQDGEGHDKPGTWSLGASADDPGKDFSRYDDWLASQAELQGGPKTQPLAVVDADDTLRAGPGAELVEVRPAPLIKHYTTERDRLAEVRRDGRTWFVIVRGHGADASLYPVDATVLPTPTFEALAAYMAAEVASGEGVR
ncbi:MAG TPA: hypothetical protein VFV89_17965 [Nocardioides sp.]|uniref:hypothetical protein n=1 Tax=Nocardioides sp. TaxID=35761 RepID=UPI002E30FD60|nr:hypothetical protein [Nocardioides sp.]HEX5089698.1 hypothetical protein [Nocardioides sp.]